MNRYIVVVYELFAQEIEVDATSPDDAINRVANGTGGIMVGEPSHVHALDPEEWEVEMMVDPPQEETYKSELDH